MLAVALCDVVLGSVVLPALPATAATPALPLTVLVALFAGAEQIQVHLHFRGEAHTITMSEIALVLALLFAAPVHVLLAQVLASLAVRLLSRQSLMKRAFNLAVGAFDACLAVVVFRAVVETPDPGAPRTWLAAALAMGLTTVGSTLLVAAVIGISERQFERSVILSTLTPAIAITAVNTALALGLGIVIHLQPLATVLLVVPIAFTVVGYRAYTNQVEERHRIEVLRACNRLLHTADALPARLSAGLELCRDTLRAEKLQLALWPGQALTAPDGHDATPLTLALAGVSRDGQTRRYDGQRGDADLRNRLLTAGARQGIVAPMRSGDTVVGALVAVDRLGRVARYSREDERLLDAVAEQVAIMLAQNALADSLTQLNIAQIQLVHQANHDALTGLANRRQLMDQLGEKLEHRHTGAGPAPALVLFDLDGFKGVNDSLGHATGDALLRVVADRLTDACRPGDLPARLGGDEFVVLLAGPLTQTEADLLTAALQDAVCGRASVDGHTITIRASFGVALAGPSVQDAAQAMQYADHAMYQAKRQRDGIAQSYNAHDQARDDDKRAMRQDLDAALAARQISLAYQPVVSVGTGELVGVEALARWQHPTRGLVNPEEFIALAESTGQIIALGHHVLTEACRQLALWQRTTPRSGHSVGVNLSVQQLLEPSLTGDFNDILRATGADPTRLILEITESGVLTDHPAAKGFLTAVRRQGVRIAIDDFGSGYASVNHLRRLPVDILKLDRTLVQGALHTQADAEICRSIISLAAALRLTVIAEGIETAQHAHLVRDLGFPLAQGHHHGRPGPAASIDELLLTLAISSVPAPRSPAMRRLPD